MDGKSAECHCSQPLSFGSLFAGIGGFDLGFERAGMVCKWQVEINGYANRILAKHWPHVRRWPDVRTWPQSDTERVDVICGGFPCVNISQLGDKAGIDDSVDGSGLWREAIRIVCILRPRFFIVENVAEILFRGADRVFGDMATSGYDCRWECLPASAFGAPHQRDRFFGFCVDRNANGGNGGAIREVQNIHSDAWRIRKSEWWNSEPGMDRVVNGISNRVDRNRGLGNAVVPQVAEWIGRRIVETAGRKPAADCQTTEAGCR